MCKSKASTFALRLNHGGIMRFRTIQQALDELKEIDPKTSLSYSVIKKLADMRKISQVKSGNKTMVDIDTLFAFLKGEEVNATYTELEE